jgi:hypothetical protein
MTRDEIMAPFATLKRGMFQHASGAIVEIAEVPTRSVADVGAARAATASLLSALNAPAAAEGWMFFGTPGEPVRSTPPEPAGMTAEDHHLRVRAMQATLVAAGVERAFEVRGLPAGWTRVLETACDGIANRMSLPDAGRVRIAQAKEKFGTLRLYVDLEGDDAFVEDIRTIATWAETSTNRRCAVTGEPGRSRRNGWVLVLNDEMDVLMRSDREAFSNRIYPPEPKEPEFDSGPGLQT